MILFGLVLWHINHCRLSKANKFKTRPNSFLLHIIRCFQVLLSFASNSIHHYSFVCTQLNGFMNCYVTLLI